MTTISYLYLVSARMLKTTKLSAECDWNNGICQFALNLFDPFVRVQSGRCSIGDGYCSSEFTILDKINGRLDCRDPRSPICTGRAGNYEFKVKFSDLDSGSVDGLCKVGNELKPIYDMIRKLEPQCVLPLAIRQGTDILTNIVAPKKNSKSSLLGLIL